MLTLPHLRVACALIERDGCLLMAQRPADKHLGGKWEFPGGKVEAGESDAQALRRELREELGCTVDILHTLPAHSHVYEQLTVTLLPYVVRLAPDSPEPQSLESNALRWVPRAELATLDLPAADFPIIADYERALAHPHPAPSDGGISQ